jgi:hypothetical protein
MATNIDDKGSARRDTGSAPILKHDISTQEEAGERPAEKPYSIFTIREKWFIVTMCAFAGLFR